jgi:hypothetical protein
MATCISAPPPYAEALPKELADPPFYYEDYHPLIEDKKLFTKGPPPYCVPSFPHSQLFTMAVEVKHAYHAVRHSRQRLHEEIGKHLSINLQYVVQTAYGIHGARLGWGTNAQDRGPPASTSLDHPLIQHMDDMQQCLTIMQKYGVTHKQCWDALMDALKLLPIGDLLNHLSLILECAMWVTAFHEGPQVFERYITGLKPLTYGQIYEKLGMTRVRKS